MSFAEEIQNAQRVYKDILNGYSVLEYDSNTMYIKHLSDIDHGWIQEYKNKIYYEAQKKGLSSEEEKIDILIEQKLWSKEKDEELKDLASHVTALYTTKAKLVVKSQVKQVEREIKKQEKKLSEISEEKSSLLGITCESYSGKKTNEKYLQYTLYKDIELTQLKFTEEEFDDLDDQELTAYVLLNNAKLGQFSQSEIRKVSAAAFFINSIMICKDNPHVFYGRPVCNLTNYQADLFASGVRNKSIIEQKGKTPPRYETLKETADWYDAMGGSSSSSSSNPEKEVGGSTVFGANKEELMSMTDTSGDDRNVVDLNTSASKLMKEKGKKSLDMMDMLKIHGELD